ncbi:MAG: metalloregulator ArsR/SmtB family transcription factor [Chloroflexota bacterium]
MEYKDAVTILTALAQETRLKVFRTLVKAHRPEGTYGGLPAGEVASQLGVPAATLSFHLKEMLHAGLLVSRREGRSIIYKANLDRMASLTQYLLEDCCGGACGTINQLDDKKECC